MLHPLLSAALRRPDLVLAHLRAYGALAQEEGREAGDSLRRQTLAWAVAAASALLCLHLSALALMLGLVLERFHWALPAVPGAFLVAAVLAWAWARRCRACAPFAELRAQLRADLQAWHELQRTR